MDLKEEAKFANWEARNEIYGDIRTNPAIHEFYAEIVADVVSKELPTEGAVFEIIERFFNTARGGNWSDRRRAYRKWEPKPKVKGSQA